MSEKELLTQPKQIIWKKDIIIVNPNPGVYKSATVEVFSMEELKDGFGKDETGLVLKGKITGCYDSIDISYLINNHGNEKNQDTNNILITQFLSILFGLCLGRFLGEFLVHMFF